MFRILPKQRSTLWSIFSPLTQAELEQNERPGLGTHAEDLLEPELQV